MKKKGVREKPTIEQLKGELNRTKYRKEYYRVLTNTVFTLIVVAALTVLVAVIWLPVLEIYGTSMNPTLKEGEYVVSVSTKNLERGDLVAFYFGNKLLVKRCIGLPGDLVDIDESGTVFINAVALDEPYLPEKARGDDETEFPVEVPQEQYFLLGDRRATSLDSRNPSVGCIAVDQIVGKVVFRIWPLERFGQIGES